MNELLQMHHATNKLGMGFEDNNNAVLEKSLIGFINDYEVCVIWVTYIFTQT